MKKYAAIILASLIIALPLYGCSNSDNDKDNTNENETSVTQTSEEEATGSNQDISTFNTTMANAQTIELEIKVCMADLISKNDEVYDGTTTYTDALGMQRTVPNVSDTFTTVDKDGNTVNMHIISIADVAGVKNLNEIYETVTYQNTEYSPYWITDTDTCVFLDSEGNSIDGDSYEINSSIVVALTENGIPSSEVYVDSL